MNYKTIVLELIRERPALHERLRSSSNLLSMMNQWAIELRESHLVIIDQIQKRQPQAFKEQWSSEALEIAIQQLQESMSSQEEDRPQL